MRAFAYLDRAHEVEETGEETIWQADQGAVVVVVVVVVASRRIRVANQRIQRQRERERIQ